MRRIGHRIPLVLAFLLLFAPGSLRAQGVLGAVTGVVTDPSGAIIPGATIKVTEVSTSVTTIATADAAGIYLAPVPPGTYRVEASKPGFRTAVWTRVIVDPSQHVTVNVRLQVGNVQQTVIVSSKPPELNTTSGQVGETINLADAAALPVGAADGGRDPEAFIFSSLAGSQSNGSSWTGSVGGGQYFSTDVMVDGISVLDYQRQGGTLLFYRPGYNAFQEVTVQESGYSAEYGDSAGGVLNYQMKSGTNQLHGDAWEFQNNQALEANGFDYNAIPEPHPGITLPRFNDNNFGADLGGPVVIPGLYNGRDKTFFYATYDGDRDVDLDFSGTTTLPTPQMLQGDFSQILGPEVGTDDLGRPIYQNEIFNPTTTRNVTAGQVDPTTGLVATATGTVREPFPGNVIPAQYFSTASKKFLSYFPNPTTYNSIYNNTPTIGGAWPYFDQDLWSVKVDHVINDKHRISMYFDNNGEDEIDRHRGPQFEPIGPPIQDTGQGYFESEIARFSEDWSVNNHVLNHFGIGYNRFSSFEIKPDSSPLPPSALGLTPNVASTTVMPQISLTGNIPFDGTMGSPEAENDVTESYILMDNFTDLLGKHTLVFGGQAVRFHYNNYSLPWSASVSFNSLQTASPGFETETGDQFASFLMGAVASAGEPEYVANPGYRQDEFEPYAQDSWRVTRKLTLNYGLRWDIPTPKHEAFNRMSNFNFTEIDPAIGVPGAMQFLGNCTGCTGNDSFENMYWGMLAPRFGLAYNPTKNFVIRGAYGIDYMPDIQNGTGYETLLGYNGFLTMTTSSIPNPFPALNPALYWTGLSGAALPAGTQVGFLPWTGHLPDISPSVSEGNGVDYIPPDSLKGPQVQNWNFGIEYQLPANMLLDVDYLGQKGTWLQSPGFGGLVQSGKTKYMGLGDILGDDMGTALSTPSTAAVLAQYGITGLPYASFSGPVSQGVLPFPQVYGITNDYPYFGNSTYNTFQTQLTKRVGNGLTFIIGYNWEKALTDSSLSYGAGAADYYNQKTQKAVASFNYPQQLKVTWVYNLPFGVGRHWMNSSGLKDKLLGGWTVSAIQNYYSGDPLSLSTNISSAITGGAIYPDQNLGVPETVAWKGPLNNVVGNQYLNPAAFRDPPVTPINGFALAFGTVSPYLPNIRGDAHYGESASLFKKFYFNERWYLTVRGDFFNLFNRTGLADPNTDVDSPLFGTITDVQNGPRSIQLQLQLNW
jgi:hypothetical protein